VRTWRKGKGESSDKERMPCDARNGMDVAKEYAVLSVVGQHPHVVRAFAVLTSSNGRPGLLMEAGAENLFSYSGRLKMCQDVPWFESRKSVLALFRQTLFGLSYVHSRSILHLDMKHKNILVFPNGDNPRAALADFGLSAELDDKHCVKALGYQVYTVDFRCSEALYADRDQATLNPKP
jgi:serine/threonine protein kinase